MKLETKIMYKIDIEDFVKRAQDKHPANHYEIYQPRDMHDVSLFDIIDDPYNPIKSGKGDIDFSDVNIGFPSDEAHIKLQSLAYRMFELALKDINEKHYCGYKITFFKQLVSFTDEDGWFSGSYRLIYSAKKLSD